MSKSTKTTSTPATEPTITPTPAVSVQLTGEQINWLLALTEEAMHNGAGCSAVYFSTAGALLDGAETAARLDALMASVTTAQLR